MSQTLLTSFASALLLASTTSSPAAVLLFDFGAAVTANQSAAPTNNVVEAQATIINATTTTAALSGITVATANFSASNTAGTLAPTGSAAIFEATATRDSLFGNSKTTFLTYPARPNATVTFSNLDISGATVYSFDFFASRSGAGVNRETEYLVQGLTSSSVLLNPVDNISTIASVNSMIPNAGGVITVTVAIGPNNTTTEGFFYLGALRLTTAPVPEPSSTLLIGMMGATAVLRRRRARS